MDERKTLRIFRRQDRTAVLGPGMRAVIWVQGCPFGCPGCIVPESWAEDGGQAYGVEELAAWLLALDGIEGLTLSGGEPMKQPAALCAFIDIVRARRDLGVMCYTGYRHGDLQHRGSEWQRALLARTDLLIDGPYIQSRHADLLWRGSDNQRLIDLSGRYSAVLAELGATGSGLELEIDNESLFFTGVPPQPGFREALAAGLAARGILLDTKGEQE